MGEVTFARLVLSQYGRALGDECVYLRLLQHRVLFWKGIERSHQRHDSRKRGDSGWRWRYGERIALLRQPTGRQCLVSRAGRRRREQTVEFSQPLFSLATQTEPRLPRSTGRRNIKVTLTPRPFHGDLTSLFFVAPQSHALQCSFTLTVPCAPVRISASVSNRFD